MHICDVCCWDSGSFIVLHKYLITESSTCSGGSLWAVAYICPWSLTSSHQPHGSFCSFLSNFQYWVMAQGWAFAVWVSELRVSHTYLCRENAQKLCISPNEKIGRYTFISSSTNVVDNLSNGKNFALKVSKILPLSTLWKPSNHRRGLGGSGTRQCSESLDGQWDKVAEIGYGSELMAI